MSKTNVDMLMVLCGNCKKLENKFSLLYYLVVFKRISMISNNNRSNRFIPICTFELTNSSERDLLSSIYHLT